MAELTVRIGTAADAPAVSNLLYEFNGEALPPPALVERMQEVQGLETAFIVELDGVAVGLLVLRTVPTLSDSQDWAEITEMYVRPAFRRRGVGRVLIEAAIEHARRHGCTEVHLLVDPANRTAIAFYEAVRFCRDSWEMRREL